MDSLCFLMKSQLFGEFPNLSNMNSDFTSENTFRNNEITNMDDGISMFRQFCQFNKSELLRILFVPGTYTRLFLPQY